MEPIDTYGGEGGNGADDIVLLSHPNPTTPLHHVTLTAKPHAFAGAVLTPKHARELTPALVLSVVVSLAEQASSTKGGGGGGAAAHGSASVTGSISGASAPAAGAHHGHTPSGASSTGGGGHGGVPPPPPVAVAAAQPAQPRAEAEQQLARQRPHGRCGSRGGQCRRGVPDHPADGQHG